MFPKEHADRFIVDVEREKYWLSKGAQPTERLEKMLSAMGLVNAPATREQPKKSAPKAKALERIKEKEEKARAAAEAAAQAEAPAEEASAE